ncbi:MAG: cob(I)yrinic acid a,c-diamide adenosyltransferase [Patescibacteria group bacterium]
MIIVFTGNGKGKTTAALGQAIRALGQGKKVLVIQFIKGPWISGEDKFAKKIKNLRIIKTGKGFVKILGDKLPFKKHRASAQEGLQLAKKSIASKKYDLIILDEINNAVDLKLLKASDVLKIIKFLPEKTDLILTGRNAPKSLIRIADLVTEMKEIKHPFQKNKKSARAGIEF